MSSWSVIHAFYTHRLANGHNICVFAFHLGNRICRRFPIFVMNDYTPRSRMMGAAGEGACCITRLPHIDLGSQKVLNLELNSSEHTGKSGEIRR